MPVVVKLNQMMRKRKVKLMDLSEGVSITKVNLSKIKTGKSRHIRFSTLNNICKELNCQPGDILEFRRETEEELFG